MRNLRFGVFDMPAFRTPSYDRETSSDHVLVATAELLMILGLVGLGLLVELLIRGAERSADTLADMLVTLLH